MQPNQLYIFKYTPCMHAVTVAIHIIIAISTVHTSVSTDINIFGMVQFEVLIHIEVNQMNS